MPTPSTSRSCTSPPGSPARDELAQQLKRQACGAGRADHDDRRCAATGRGPRLDVVQPHDHASVLGTLGDATSQDARDAVEAALRAAPAWRAMSFDERAAVFLKAADLLAGPWRET